MEPIQTTPTPSASWKTYVMNGASKDDGYFHQRSEYGMVVRNYSSVVVDGEEYWRSSGDNFGGEFFSVKPDVDCDDFRHHGYCLEGMDEGEQNHLLKKYEVEYDPTIVF